MREGSGADAAMKSLLTELAAIKQTLLRSGADNALRAQGQEHWNSKYWICS